MITRFNPQPLKNEGAINLRGINNLAELTEKVCVLWDILSLYFFCEEKEEFLEK